MRGAWPAGVHIKVSRLRPIGRKTFAIRAAIPDGQVSARNKIVEQSRTLESADHGREALRMTLGFYYHVLITCVLSCMYVVVFLLVISL